MKKNMIIYLLVILFPFFPCMAADFFDGADKAGRSMIDDARMSIEKIRKGNFNISFVGPDGKAVREKAVIRLLKHEFIFGANLTPVSSLDPGHPAREIGLAVTVELFPFIRLGNFWSHMEPVKGGRLNWDIPDMDVKWAQERGLEMRFHCLIYNHPGAIPRWYKTIKTEDEWWALIENRIKAVARRFGKIVHEYDVINEMLMDDEWAKENNPIFPSLAVPKNGARIFSIAKKYLPDAKLVSLEGRICTKESEAFREIYKYQKSLIEAGAPVNVIGYQALFYAGKNMPFQEGHPEAGPGAFTMKKLSKGLDYLGTLGKPIHITEFSPPSRNNKIEGPQPRLSDEEVAAWTVNFYTLAFSKPYINELTRWFIIDNKGGRGMDAGLVTEEGRKKPAYFAIKKLLKEDWSTKWDGVLTNGVASFRGFYGTYEAAIPGYKPARFKIHAADKPDLVVRMKKK